MGISQASGCRSGICWQICGYIRANLGVGQPMLERARLNQTATGFGRNLRWRGRGKAAAMSMGIAFAASLFAASGAQAQNCTIPTVQFVSNLGGIGSSPASVSSMIGSTITAASTAFLLQSTAFIGSPPNPQPDQQAGGIWVRGVGGEVSVKSSTTTFVSQPFPPIGNSGTVSCFQKVDETFAGVQFGRDLGILNVNGWNFHWGATAGYIGTSSSIAGGAVSFPDQGTTAGGGPFNSTTNIPFIGAYAAATYNGFSVDALLRTEYYQTSLNAPGVNLFNQEIDAHGITFAASAAYQWQVPNSDWFIEPSAGVIISRIKVDPFNYLTAGTVNDRLSGTLQLNDIKSDIGRLGLRFGTTVNTGNVVWQPFASVSVWHEFGPNIISNYATCPGSRVLSLRSRAHRRPRTLAPSGNTRSACPRPFLVPGGSVSCASTSGTVPNWRVGAELAASVISSHLPVRPSQCPSRRKHRHPLWKRSTGPDSISAPSAAPHKAQPIGVMLAAR
jgi:hypothetical protein